MFHFDVDLVVGHREGYPVSFPIHQCKALKIGSTITKKGSNSNHI